MSDFEKSNSNIFADLGDPEAEQTLVRAQILSRIIDIINERNFTEAETAETLGISKLEASQLIKGKLSQFSLVFLITNLRRYIIRLHRLSLSLTIVLNSDCQSHY